MAFAERASRCSQRATPGRIRTYDKKIKSLLLYQLSYGGVKQRAVMVSRLRLRASGSSSLNRPRSVPQSAMSAALALNTSVLGQEVPVARVVSALRELWSDESAKMRASLMNFAIYSEDPSSLEHNTLLLSELTREHSCRALLILNIPGERQPHLRAWVTAHCQLSNGQKSVCCEQLSFVIEGGNADQVRNTIFAHLDSDLPLVVWWQGELTERLDERFLSVIDALIIDSSQWSSPAQSLRQMMEARAGRTSRFSLSDLTWMRTRCLRLTLAAAFQSAPLLADLPKLNRVVVHHAKGHRLGGLMIAAWMGTQLHCQVGQGQGIRLVREAGEDIAVELHEANGSCAIQGLELSGPGISIRIRRDPVSGLSHTMIDHPSIHQETVHPVPANTEVDMIGEQLSRLGGTTRYFETTPLLLALLEQE